MSGRLRTQTKTMHLIVRCSPDEHAAVERIAQAENLSLSALLRRSITALLDEAAYPPPQRKRKAK